MEYCSAIKKECSLGTNYTMGEPKTFLVKEARHKGSIYMQCAEQISPWRYKACQWFPENGGKVEWEAAT